MDEASRFVKIAAEIFIWGGALPALLGRIGEATNMPSISDDDKMMLAATSKHIGELFQKVERALDAGHTDNLATIAEELRDEVVKANVILDRLKVPDSE